MSRDERGMVTAETAAVLPLLVAVTLAMIWVLTVGVAQVRVTDAAREAARAAARGDSDAQATALAQQAAPGAEVSIATDGEQVTVTARDQVVPLGLFAGLGTVTVEAEAVALDEAS